MSKIQITIADTTEEIFKVTGVSRTMVLNDNGHKGIVDNPSDNFVKKITEANQLNQNITFHLADDSGNGGLIKSLKIDNEEVVL